MFDEKTYVKKAFERNFVKFKNEPIVIYGLGNNTSEIIQSFPDYKIVGLMDGYRTGDIVFGKKVINNDELLELNVKVIVIIARYANLKIIYRRIEKFCKDNRIQVFDINGNKIELNDQDPINREYQSNSKQLLYDMIDNADVISFDIFDTILMRDVLHPQDIFYLMEYELSKISSTNFNFVKERIKAEMNLYSTGNPTINDIYNSLKNNNPDINIEAQEMIDLEIKIEKEHLLIRDEMVNCYKYAKQKSKKIYFTSDMYLNSRILHEVLVEKGIDVELNQILVSCDYGVPKSSGLFKVLKEDNYGKRIIHIGDNKESDNKSAYAFGLDDAFLISSAYHMLEESNASIILKYVDNLSERNFVGTFIAKQFNNPFLFSETNGKSLITSEYELGYYFMYPIICCFISWLLKRTKKMNITNLLLSARDGYLIKKVLDILQKRGISIPNYQYFYTSRSVCLLAGMVDERDIIYASSLAFSGTIEELLEKRYGLRKEEIKIRKENEIDIDYILRHSKIILDNAKSLRRKYFLYMKKIGINKNLEYGFFDFVSSGTCQLGLNNFSGLNLVGLYFVKIYDEYKVKLEIKAMYESKCIYEKQDAIMDFYLFMENILTSFEPTLIDFTVDGEPVFAQENRSASQLKSLADIQNGILDAFMNIHSHDSMMSNLGLADTFLKIIDNKYSEISVDYFANNPLKDEFCNREFTFNN